MKQHTYASRVVWTGNRGQGTATYKGYDRTWDLCVPGKPVVHCSNDPLIGGDPAKPNPEDLLVSAISACHMLWYLHLASEAGIVVNKYDDRPEGIGELAQDASGQFVKMILRPQISVEAGADMEKAHQLHHDVHKFCFIARSVNFPIEYAPEFTIIE